jgi:hypothetical protein
MPPGCCNRVLDHLIAADLAANQYQPVAAIATSMRAAIEVLCAIGCGNTGQISVLAGAVGAV